MGDYVRRGGLRFVRPYYFDYFAFVKPRWEGATVVDLFTREFTGRSREYYQAALLAGRLRVDDTSMSAPRKNGGRRAKPRAAGDAAADAAPQEAPAPVPRPQPQPPPAQPAQDAPLRSGQRVRHFVHRHEPPVRRAVRWRRTRRAVHVAHLGNCAYACDTARGATQVLDMPIVIVATTDTAVAVCKPASMPVHPTARPATAALLRLAHSQRVWAAQGQYRKNSLMGILASEVQPRRQRAHTLAHHSLLSSFTLAARSDAGPAVPGASPGPQRERLAGVCARGRRRQLAQAADHGALAL